jgi:hypothetical protein
VVRGVGVVVTECRFINTTLDLPKLGVFDFLHPTLLTNVTCSGQCETHTVSGIEYRLTKYVATYQCSFFEV